MRAAASTPSPPRSARRWPNTGRVALLHRTGRLELGESSVIVAVSSPHRAEAFDAARYGIDTLKATAPIWKQETWAGGEDWALGAHDSPTSPSRRGGADGEPRLPAPRRSASSPSAPRSCSPRRASPRASSAASSPSSSEMKALAPDGRDSRRPRAPSGRLASTRCCRQRPDAGPARRGRPPARRAPGVGPGPRPGHRPRHGQHAGLRQGAGHRPERALRHRPQQPERRGAGDRATRPGR